MGVLIGCCIVLCFISIAIIVYELTGKIVDTMRSKANYKAYLKRQHNNFDLWKKEKII